MLHRRCCDIRPSPVPAIHAIPLWISSAIQVDYPILPRRSNGHIELGFHFPSPGQGHVKRRTKHPALISSTSYVFCPEISVLLFTLVPCFFNSKHRLCKRSTQGGEGNICRRRKEKVPKRNRKRKPRNEKVLITPKANQKGQNTNLSSETK